MILPFQICLNPMFLCFIGTTKRKELHGKTGIRMLSGTWGDKHDGAFFESYKLDFSCNIAEQRYSSFILLIESKLDDDVGNIELELFLLAKFVHSSVSASRRTYLQGDQVNIFILLAMNFLIRST